MAATADASNDGRGVRMENDTSGGVGGRSRTILWCTPRTVSTALCKCLSAVEGNEVWFEPYFYSHVITKTAVAKLNLNIPSSCKYEGNEEVYQQAAGIFDIICKCKSNPEYFSLASLKRFLEESESPHVFVKDMACVIDRDRFRFFPKGFTHAFLIRHPLRVFTSFRKASFSQLSGLGILEGEAADEETFDVGRDFPYADPTGVLFRELHDVWMYARETSDRPPIVIDSSDLLAKPAEVLPKFCEAVGLPFDESMLKWDASADVVKKWKFSAEGVVENMTLFYERAITSSEFSPPGDMPDRDQLTPDVIRCADEAMKYYNEMYEARLKI